ncbi:hypothetical protein [Novosphingobium sp. P6W]|uniref:hypothetical protein n=1 Tax=Novosphingobium sp. P6W TaxID=1609758 RepID=UPI000A832C5A|nr:hypothetical protein [Novosphingobium sp. P6W]
MKFSSVTRRINEDDILRALRQAPVAGWPQDETELAVLFNFVLEDFAVANQWRGTIAVND